MGRPPAFPPGHPLASKHVRDKYGQSVPGGPEPADMVFEPIVFQAFVSPSGMKINPAAQSMEIPFYVIGAHIDEALPLRRMAASGMPLLVTIEVWPDAAAQISENARQLDEKYGRPKKVADG